MSTAARALRAVSTALMAGALLAAGCAQLPRRASADKSAASNALSPAQERRIEAHAAYAAGVSAELRQGLEAALPHYQRALELDPSHTPLALRLAQWHLSRRDFEQARQVLERARAVAPNSPDLLLWLALVHRSSEQPAKAVELLQHARRLAPQRVDLIQALADVYLSQEATTELTRLLEQAWQQPVQEAGYWLRYGELLAAILKQKPSLAPALKPDRISQAYEKARSLQPDNVEILLRLGDLYADNGQFESAATHYAAAVRLRPNLPHLQEKLALMYLRTADKSRAIEPLVAIIKREPGRFEVYNLLGELYEELDKDQTAISYFQQSLVVNPNQLAPYLQIAVLELKRKRYDAALAVLETAREKFPTTHLVPFYMGLVHSERKAYADAVTQFAEAHALAREAAEEVQLDSNFYFYYGAASERAGRFDQAVQLFRKALELNPDNHQTLNWLGYMWADKGTNLTEALQLIEKAVQLDPDNAAYLDSLGWVLHKLGRSSEALPHLRRSIELSPNDPVVLDHLAEVLAALGQYDEARRHWQHAATLDPGNTLLQQKIEKLTAPSPPP